MHFRKYPSIENHYRDKYIDRWVRNNHGLQFERFIIVEKIHGANFQMLIGKDNVRYASRNMMLKEDSSFFGYQEVMKGYEDMISKFQQLAVDEDIESIRVYGELFGSNIQKGVDYGKDKQFKIFDIYIDEDLLSQEETMLLLDLLELNQHFVPILTLVDSLEDALNFDTEFDTKLSDKKDNECEGVVIKPYRKVYNFDNSPFYLKKKNASFMEKQKSKGSNYKPPSNQLLKVQGIFSEYLTENRVEGVYSKFGIIEDQKSMGKYIRLVTDDAKEDFFKDHMGEFDLLTDKEKRSVFSISGKIIAPILMKSL